MKAALTLALVGVYLLTLCHSKATMGEKESDKYNDEEANAEEAKSQQTHITFNPSGTKSKQIGMGPSVKVEFLPGNSGYYGGSGQTNYIRWGKTACPDTDGTQLIYKGRAAGSHYTHKGGAADLLCIPEEEPEFLSSRNGGSRSILYQVEYETSAGPSYQNLQNHDVPCATCLSTKRGTKIMIPGKVKCMDGWTREYYGYLMADHYSHRRNQFTCVDINAEGVPGTSKDLNGALLYHVEVHTGSFPSSYTNGNEMACVVCTK